MLSRWRTAAKFFAWGLLLGLIFAPASGQEVRRRLLRWAMSQLEGCLGAARQCLLGIHQEPSETRAS